ncbi:TetR/AcrR family transcriptional regulator [Rhodococcus triatomae]|uniref:DNA-binding transcriptional regulator, AcrR family n=1 Tax=Rhodococcus triatomae TaxID=300028 RepID=A0A1G8H4N7_9NOCA|nr:TetR/AcrR family transcriptional regulator [Rhodococcus triatomae]QNG20211.1 TetR/AcrR family transcriptional regulator [Rhodococcus triatomae]QNG23874.1 TetR/AcrR family transcriptional regulator [Rhodococcus triatomae]SDI01480.1 DNA-binding transcriptional regulator, AcrR family [Rhodococcus triatomae]
MAPTRDGPVTDRVYGGQDGEARRSERRRQLIEAALDMLGGGEALSVRGVCKRSGLATRYFYESFGDRDALAVAAYDHVVEQIVHTTLTAVAAATGVGEREIVQAAVQNIVRSLAEDPRKAHVLFSAAAADPQLAQRRLDSTRLFAGLVTRQTVDYYDVPESPHVDLTAHFMVGGFAQTLTAWLNGTVTLGEEEVVDICTELLLSLAIHTR